MSSLILYINNCISQFKIKNQKCKCSYIVNNPMYVKSIKSHKCSIHPSYKSLMCNNYHLKNKQDYTIFTNILKSVFPYLSITTLINIYKTELNSYISFLELKLREEFKQIFSISDDYGHMYWESILKYECSKFDFTKPLPQLLLELFPKQKILCLNIIKTSYLPSVGLIHCENYYEDSFELYNYKQLYINTCGIIMATNLPYYNDIQCFYETYKNSDIKFIDIMLCYKKKISWYNIKDISSINFYKVPVMLQSVSKLIDVIFPISNNIYIDYENNVYGSLFALNTKSLNSIIYKYNLYPFTKNKADTLIHLSYLDLSINNKNKIVIHR